MYTVKSEVVDYYVPGSILALYVLVTMISLLIIVIRKLCCKINRVRYYGAGGEKQPADMASKDDKNNEVGKDVFEFEMAKGSSKWDKKKQKFPQITTSTSMLIINDQLAERSVEEF